MKTTKTITIDFTNLFNIIKEAEGGWEGWYIPVFADIEEYEDGTAIMSLSHGSQLSQNSWVQDADFVGKIDCWQREWTEDEKDVERWVEETGCDESEYNSDYEMQIEAGVEADRIKEEIKESSDFSYKKINLHKQFTDEGLLTNCLDYARFRGYDYAIIEF